MGYGPAPRSLEAGPRETVSIRLRPCLSNLAGTALILRFRRLSRAARVGIGIEKEGH